MSDAVIRPLGRPGDLGWVVMAHGEHYTAEYGWSPAFEAHVARFVADFAAGHDTTREAAWIAEVGGRRVGSVACTAGEPDTAHLRVLLLDPAARGHGLGRRLVETCVGFAVDAGYRRMQLWTTDVLETAQRIYRAAGFRLVAEEPFTEFGPELLGRTYALELPAGTSRRAMNTSST
ncbi:GNAT family N-acetyltransferase [Pseudonocardia sp. GCM10023141]|uniref:GNAT family N-acetyltransferase n=1 Tax=Pseudonocardia sp. GCM10023141 TaxID=3252653 RepID=UPI003618B1C6